MIEAMQPIVLVGGRSRRFGRDKLREPLVGGEGGWLVDRPIGALREVFGARVAVVGVCDPEIAARADLVIADLHPGVGPIGGIVSALEQTGTAVFVLPGDLARITAGVVRSVVEGAALHPGAWAVLAASEGGGDAEPCIGVYRARALVALRGRLGEGRHRLWDALPAERIGLVEVPRECVANVNTPGDLGRA